MTDRSAPRRGGSSSGSSSGRPDDDGWGPSTAVFGGTGAQSAERFGRALNPQRATAQSRTSTPPRTPSAARTSDAAQGRRGPTPPPGSTPPPVVRRPREDGWTPAGPVTRDKQRANKLMERQLRELRVERTHERGLTWIPALLILIAIAVLGGVIDTVDAISVSNGFNFGIVIASIVGILVVKRSHMFPIVISPPIVYSLAAVFQLYLRSSGLHDKKVVLDAAANYLVYGFPAIAAATAAVLIIAGFRLIARR